MGTHPLQPLFRWVFIVIALMLDTGCTRKESPLPDHRGGKLFHGDIRMDVKCHGCHGWVGEGGGNAPPLVQLGRTISHAKFINAVLHGKGGMPPFDTVLSEDDVRQIIDWLEKIPQ